MNRHPSWADYGTFDEAVRPHLWYGRVAAWAPCLGSTGFRVLDVVSGKWHGTLTNMDNTDDWAVSEGQYCLDFNDTPSADTTNHGTFNIPLNDATICAWVYNRGITSFDRFVDCGYNTGFHLSCNASGLTAGGGFKCDPSPYGTFGTITLNKWYFVAVTRRGTTNRAYINGSNATSSDYTGSSGTTATTNTLRFATSDGTQAAGNFRIDDVAIYNRALSDDGIRELSLYRGVAYERRRRRTTYFYETNPSAGGGGGSGGSVGLAQPLSFKLSEPLSVRL